jgi:hypothetical protein
MPLSSLSSSPSSLALLPAHPLLPAAFAAEQGHPAAASDAARHHGGQHDGEGGGEGTGRSELLVKFRRPLPSSSSLQSNATTEEGSGAVQLVESYDKLGMGLVRIPNGLSASQAAQQYMRSGIAEYAEPNVGRHVYGSSPFPAALFPSDPSFGL